MKKFILSLTMLFSLMSQAQTIHWLTYIDTTDDSVGKIDVLGRQVLYNRFINVVNAALVQAGYKTDIQDYYGTRLTPEAMKNSVESLRCESNDIIVFYYIGHGGRAKGDDNYLRAHPYPQMCCAQHNPNRFIPLEWVYNTLKSKGARLSVTIGMCCNSESPSIRAKERPQFGINYGPTYVDNNLMKKIQDLFLTSKGNILVTSATPRQNSGCVESDLGVIDTFTTFLIRVFDFYAENDTKMDWQKILQDIKESVHYITRGKQTPIFETQLTQASAPAKKTSSKPSGTVTPPKAPQQPSQAQTQTTSSDERDKILNLASRSLDYITNSNNSEEDRIDVAEMFKEIFVKGAKIKFLGQDGEQVIDKETASNFIDRISTSRLILKVAPAEITLYGNTILEMKVREIYKK